MSRLDKAIEVATRKRSQTEDAPPPLESSSASPEKVKVLGQTKSLKPMIKVENPYLVMANDQNSLAAEQYRKLKSLVVKLTKMGDLGKALMVTSSIANEGKTITSINLAISLAEEFDHTVLLVEADVRKPSILNYLGIKADRGLTDCVIDGLDISDVLVKTGLGELTILPAGKRVDNPVELFSSNRMHQLMSEIMSRYSDRYVIVDTTPLLPFAEPHYMANIIGNVLLVVREGVTSPDKLKRSLEILKNNNLLGVVSNGVTRVSSMQGYYGYYGYQ